MEKSKLKIGKTWISFWICSSFFFLFIVGMTWSLLTDYNSVIAFLLCAMIVMSAVASYRDYPGSYLLFYQDGITCVKKVPFKPQEVIHYDWRDYEKLVYFTNGKIMLLKVNEEDANYIVCSDYGGLPIEFNGKKKVCLSPQKIGSYIGIICKENNIQFELLCVNSY